MDHARRSFFQGRAGAQPLPFRPPWALAEAAFTSACTRCGECIQACPTGLLKSGPGRYPIADFQAGYCDFCGECSRVCAPHAITADTTAKPWSLVAAIGTNCLTHQDVVCRTCGEICSASAIRLTPRVGGVARPTLDNERCTGCGECLAPCPTQAIAIGRLSPSLTSEHAA